MSDLIPDYEEDIFISYAHIDNYPVAKGHHGWVDIMHRMLERRLAQLMGEQPKVWRDAALGGNAYFGDMHALRLSKVAILVAVLSPRYVRSDFCLAELKTFYRNAEQASGISIGNRSRIFKVIKTPIEGYGQPLELKGLLGYNFYEIDPASGRPLEFIPEIGFETYEKFILKVDDLAYDIKALIEQMQKTSAASSQQQPPPPPPVAPDDIKEPEALPPLRVFICHSSGDKPAARALYHRLRADSFDPWLDEEDLLAGEEWEKAIPKAVSKSDIVIVCISHNSINRSGYLHTEIKFALDVAAQQPEGTIFIIPVKLEECDVPEGLRRWHWVNLFEDEEKGYQKLIRALKVRASRLKAATERDL